MKNVDILGREIRNGDFVIYTSAQMGLRIGLVLEANLDQSPLSPYARRRCSVIALDYRNLEETLKTISTPDTNRIIVCNCIPKEYKTILVKASKEKI